MLRFLVLVALVGLCSAQAGGYRKGMMKKYAHHKIMEGCFGREMVKEYRVKMMESSKKCSSGEPHEDGNQLDFEKLIAEIRSAMLQRGSPDGQYYQLVPVLKGGRYRRDAHEGAAILDHIKEQMTYKIANVTCMLRDLNWINEDKTPNYRLYEEFINRIDDAFLRKQVLYGMDMCKDYAECMPVKKAKSPVHKELGTFIFFQSCMEMQKIQACFKKDFRESMVEYGFDPIEEKINMGLEMIGIDHHEHEEYEAYEALEMMLSNV